MSEENTLNQGCSAKKEVWERRSHPSTPLIQVNSRTLTTNIAHMQCQIKVARGPKLKSTLEQVNNC